MASIRAAGELLTASADDRTLSYLLLPYGEPGRTNKGRVTASAGCVTLPDRLVANLEHDRTRPVATATHLTETPRGLEATFSVLETSAGDDLLAEAAAGVRTGVSVEIDPVVIRGGKIVGGRLDGAGFVTQPAFPSARLTAADAGDPEDVPAEVPDDVNWTPPTESETKTTTEDTIVIDGVEYVRKTTATYETTTEVVEPELPAGEETDTEEEGDVPNEEERRASAPAGGLAARRHNNNPMKLGTDAFNRLLASAYDRGGAKGLRAALSDITQSNTPGVGDVPQYVGELWSGKAYQRRFIPLFNHANLTSYKVRGWRWITKPEVAPYTGDKTAVPSNAVETQPVDIVAERLAGAHDIDRVYRDFNDAEFFAAYNRAMTESYAQQSDAAVLADVLAVAMPVQTLPAPDGIDPAPTTAIQNVVDGALAVLDETKAAPTFALLAPDMWRQLMFTPHDAALEYLDASMGLEEGNLTSSGFRLMPAPELEPGNVLVGTRSAVTVHELGTVPIRVEALDVANGGIDVGVFGYYATNIHEPGGLVLVQPAAAPAGE